MCERGEVCVSEGVGEGEVSECVRVCECLCECVHSAERRQCAHSEACGILKSSRVS